jgi:phytoene dehydrogenase-like protein
MRTSYDAIVIGSGVGGCCIAALLAHRGKRVLLAEKRAYLGGRFSTVNRDGYMCATGSLSLWLRMAELVKQTGGEVLTGAAARKIQIEKHQVQGVLLRHQQQSHAIRAPLVISNLGPTATADLVAPEIMEASYRAQLEKVTPTAILWLHFASDELLLDYSAISVGCSRRVNMIDVPSLEAAGAAKSAQDVFQDICERETLVAI